MKRRRISLWIPVMGGILHYLSFPPFSLWPLAFLSLIPLFLFVFLEEKRWRVGLGAFLYCITYAVLSIIFILDPILLVGGSLLWLLIFLPWVLVLRRFVKEQWLFFTLLPFALVSAEYFAGNFSFLPAFLIMAGVPLAGTPFQFTALLGGLAGATLFTGLVNAGLSYALLLYGEQRLRPALWSAAGVIVLLIVGLCAAFFAPQSPKLPLSVMAVSVGEDFDMAAKKLDDPALAKTLAGEVQIKAAIQALLSPIGKEVDKKHPALVVFPEEMIDVRLPGVADPKARQEIGVTNSGPLLAEYAAFAAVHQVNLLATLVTFDADGTKYISTVSIDKEGNFTGIYHKRLLTIVTEYWPFGRWLPFYWRWELDLLPKSIQGESFVADNPTGPYAQGDANQAPLQADGVNIGPLVCLEGHFPYLYSRWSSGGAKLIVYSGSNVWLDHGRAWYHDFEMKIRELEAIYTGTPVAVAGNGEDPAIVLPDGSVIGSSAPLRSSFSWSYVLR